MPSMFRHSALLAAVAACFLGLRPSPAMAAPDVVASIKPVHSLVSAVMASVGSPQMIVSSAASPHVYAMKPSDARALQDAEVVFWIGPGLEVFLTTALEGLAGDATIVALADAEGLTRLPLREDPRWDNRDHDHAHGWDVVDPHLWLDPGNAASMVTAITDALATADPDHAATYRRNADNTIARLHRLAADLAQQLGPVAGEPYMVFHDGYQYLERRFGLSPVGAFVTSPERAPGAAQLQKVRRLLRHSGAHCIFAEPQFTPRLLSTVAEGTGARIGILDPLGADIEPGPDQYFTLMRRNADALAQCLSAGS